MYRPGKVMKCGSRDTGSDDGFGDLTTPLTASIDFTVGTPAWTSSDTMAWRRVNHNLTALPSGEVIVTGGTGRLGNESNTAPVYRPEIWSPNLNSGLGGWYGGAGSDHLADSPVVRGYHSTTALLPDG